MRVLHLVKGLGPGGAERLLVSIAEAADHSAVYYEVAYVLGEKQHLVSQLRALDVPVHLLAGSRGMADPRWPQRLRRLARTFDIIHLHSPAPAAIARPVLRAMRRGPALVSTEHNVWTSHRRATRIANALTLPLDRVRWSVSQEVVASAWQSRRAHMEVLVHGVPLSRLQTRTLGRAEARQSQGWDDDEVVVAIVANLREHKDYPTLFASAALATVEEPRLRFVSIGQGPLESELRAGLAEYHLGNRFVMLGYHEDPPAVLAGADVFTLSSRHEGLPISLLEAMTLGLPPVVTAVGGNAEVVNHGDNGLLTPPGDPRALADAYVRLARDKLLRRKLGSAAARRAADFDIARTARIVEARYRSIAGR